MIGSTENFKDYVTVGEALKQPQVTYTGYWLRRLATTGKILGIKIGEGRRGQWLLHLPSLLAYIQEMKQLGEQKHAPN